MPKISKRTDLILSALPLLFLTVILFLFFGGNAKAATLDERIQVNELELKTLQSEIDEMAIPIVPGLQTEKEQAEQIRRRIEKEQEKSRIHVWYRAYKKAKELEQQNKTVLSAAAGDHSYKDFMEHYKTAAERFKVDWFVLAAIHKIETQYSSIDNMISVAGAVGHMQFMPATFAAYGVDGDGDGRKDAWNISDAIHSAANYLSKSGYGTDQRKAIWHYNHADWYVNEVIDLANTIQGESK